MGSDQIRMACKAPLGFRGVVKNKSPGLYFLRHLRGGPGGVVKNTNFQFRSNFSNCQTVQSVGEGDSLPGSSCFGTGSCLCVCLPLGLGLERVHRSKVFRAFESGERCGGWWEASCTVRVFRAFDSGGKNRRSQQGVSCFRFW